MALRALKALALAAALHGAVAPAWAAGEAEAQARIARDVAAGRPIVVHVTVALCDNENQGIVRVPAPLGNGQDPGSNLYWGARYGVRSYFARAEGWTRVDVAPALDPRVRERVAFVSDVPRGDSSARVVLIADAWDGAEIRAAVEAFLTMASGRASEEISIARAGSEPVALAAGGSAHVAAFVGHNGLMDEALAPQEPSVPRAEASSSVVLACASKPYFLEPLRRAGSHPLLLTTGLMAPEAYTLEAALRAWIGSGSAAATREAAATAYDTYQKCGVGAARRLFWTPSD